MSNSLSPASFVAQMVSDFCVPIILGQAKRDAPVQGVELDPAGREQLGLKGDGFTVVYPVEDVPVYLDLAGNRSTLWFERGDAVSALSIVEKALERNFPTIKRTHDLERDRPGLRSRIYEGELGKGILVQIDIAYPDPKSGAEMANRFMVRVFSLLMPGAPNPLSAQGGVKP